MLGFIFALVVAGLILNVVLPMFIGFIGFVCYAIWELCSEQNKKRQRQDNANE